jgi:hypothetical protein
MGFNSVFKGVIDTGACSKETKEKLFDEVPSKVHSFEMQITYRG